MKTGVIEIENMEFYAHHGCYKEEQVVGNVFRVSFRMEVDMEKAVLSDQVSDSVNYLDVYETIREQMAVTSHILEHVAHRILEAVKERFPALLSASVKVSKMNPPLGGQAESVSVSMCYVND